MSRSHQPPGDARPQDQIEALLAALSARGVRLSLEGDQLRIQAPKGALDAPLQEALRRHKSALLQRLAGPQRHAGRSSYPLSPAQRRLWFLQQLEPGSARYHEAAALQMESRPNAEKLASALGRLVEMHEILRSSFHYRQGELIQAVHQPEPVGLAWGDADGIEAFVLAPFDLSRPSPFRVGLFGDPERPILVLVFHHLITDFWSAGLILQQLATLWEGESPEPPPLQYGDYALWQAAQPPAPETLTEAAAALARAPLSLALSAGAAPEAAAVGGLSELVLGAELLAAWEAQARALKLTRFALLLSAWQAYLARWFGLEAGTVAYPVAGRPLQVLEKLPGVFVNTRLMPFAYQPDQSLTAAAQALQSTLIADMGRPDLPFEALVGALQPPRDLPYFPQLGIVMQDSWEGELSLGGIGARWLELSFLPPKFEILLAWLGMRQALRLSFDAGMHEPTVMQALLHGFGEFFAAALAAPAAALGDLPLAPAQASPAGEPAFAGWLHQFVEAAALSRPEHPALRWQGQSIGYAELNARANRWARALEQQGLQPEARVAVQLEVSPELIVALLAILKLGAAYVPIDEDTPLLRRDALLDDCRPALLISRRAQDACCLHLSPAELEHAAAGLAETNLGQPIAPGQTAYIIYTSGSTGQPNGVCISHANAARLFTSVAQMLPPKPADIWLLFHSVAFDFSVWEIWGCFAAANTLVLLERKAARDPEQVWALIQAEGVTQLSQTPSAFRYLSRVACASAGANPLRSLILSGEKLELPWLRDWFGRFGESVDVINSYGITETTVFVTWRRIHPDDLEHGRSVIGQPLPDLGLMVLDPRLQPVPAGMTGELCVYGAGLSPGYWKRPELTAARFVAGLDGYGGRIYRSGDLVRRDADGEMVYLGRRDAQIKLRGYRIETGEIQAALERQPEITAAWVALDSGPAAPGRDARLVAWVMTNTELPPLERLRERLAAELPGPMLPARILPVAAFPLNQNGKIDTRALLLALTEQDRASAGTSENLPAGGLEAELGSVLASLLGRPTIGRDENFFSLGGHSLLMVEAREQIRARTGIALELVDLFHYPTLRQLAAHLQPQAQPGAESALTEPVAQPLGADEAIAVIGMALRLPGASDPEGFWQNLLKGVESIRRWSPQELEADGVAAAEYGQRDYVPASGWCEGIEDFAASFFGFAPREAELLDPQQRLMLELAWEALERAGYGDHRQPEAAGVFASGGISRYLLFHLAARPLPPGLNPMQVLVANDKDYLATRVAHRLNLTGPALTVQSACSSSLAAVHLACESLRRGECSLALAGGITLETRRQGYRWQAGGIYSRDGHCRPFAADATGIVGGSGGAWVVLKPLGQARRDGDPIYALIKGSALNNDGADKAGFLAPGVEGQRQVIRQALTRAHVSPAQIGVLEAHGTGTAIGDPIELRALNLAWQTNQRGYCALGSVKGNIGHLDAAAGVASLIKAVLMLHHRQIAPTINVTAPNPALGLEQSPFYLAHAAREWRGPDRHAAVSSLGIGGTNVHMILAAAPDEEPEAAPEGFELLPLSAPSAESFEALTRGLAAQLQATAPRLADVALTLQRGRQPLAWRAAVVADSPPAAADALLASALTPHQVQELPPLVFLCPGLGSQQAQMGEALWKLSPAYRRALEKCAELLAPIWPHDLQALLLEPQPAARLAAAVVMQPLIFCHGYALAQAWGALGLQPRAVLGHSFGEYLAAVLAGMATLEEMLPLVVKRGELFGRLNGGVLSVAARPEQIQNLLGDELSLATLNGPERLTVSGPAAALEAFARRATGQGLSLRRLEIPHAVHHASLEPILAELRKAAAAVHWQAPRLRVLTGLTGNWLAQAPDADFWARQARETLRFDAGLHTLLTAGDWLGIELGNGLASLCRRQGLPAIAPGRGRREWLKALAELWGMGAELRWSGLEQAGRRIPLPPTPLPRERHWIPPADPRQTAAGLDLAVRRPPAEWFALPLWRRAVLAPGRPAPVAWAAIDPLQLEATADLPTVLLADCRCLNGQEALLAAFDGLRCGLLELVRRGWKGCLSLLTTPFSRIIGTESLTPWPALLLGLVRTVSLELPGLAVRLVETDSLEALPEREWLSDEPHVAWRHGLRWLPELQPLPLAESAAHAAAGPLRQQGVYVITGAAGGIGRMLTHWLRQSYGARLVLLSRTQLEDAPDTLALQVDITRPQQVKAALAAGLAAFGRIDGIFHAAAAIGHDSLPRLTPQAMAQTLAAKLQGSLSLHQALQELALAPEFVLLFSALATQLGAPGQGAYVAANAWLEAFAQQQGAPWYAVAWSAWQEQGMAARALAALPPVWQPLYRQFLELGISPEQGCQATGQALELLTTLATPQLLVSPANPAALAKLQAQALEAARRPLPARAPKPSGQATATPKAKPEGPLESLIARVWETCLGVESGRDDSFSALGGDSLMVVQMKALLEQELGQELPLGPFLEDLSLARLARALDGEAPSENLLLRLNGPFQGAPESRPLFFVHAISGTVFPFRALAEALPRPFYGLQSRGLLGSGAQARPHAEITSMARDYCQVAAQQSPPPYTVGGWSFGALVAFEMARHWQAEGRAIEKLILLDMQAPAPGEILDIDEAGVRERFEADLRGLGPQAERMKDRLWQIFEAHVGASRSFRPEVLNLPALLLVAEKGFGATHPLPDLGWGRWLPNLSVKRVPGDHYSCLEPENLRAWVGLLAD